jgi:hypothetical protein
LHPSRPAARRSAETSSASSHIGAKPGRTQARRALLLSASSPASTVCTKRKPGGVTSAWAAFPADSRSTCTTRHVNKKRTARACAPIRSASCAAQMTLWPRGRACNAAHICSSENLPCHRPCKTRAMSVTRLPTPTVHAGCSASCREVSGSGADSLPKLSPRFHRGSLPNVGMGCREKNCRTALATPRAHLRVGVALVLDLYYAC